jgi:hypothetical protein
VGSLGRFLISPPVGEFFSSSSQGDGKSPPVPRRRRRSPDGGDPVLRRGEVTSRNHLLGSSPFPGAPVFTLLVRGEEPSAASPPWPGMAVAAGRGGEGQLRWLFGHAGLLC